jgi:hypothetical protein
VRFSKVRFGKVIFEMVRFDMVRFGEVRCWMGDPAWEIRHGRSGMGDPAG